MMYFSIENNRGQYWQCGMWVNSLHNATKYSSEDQAFAVIAMRELNGSVVPNNTEWRNLTAQPEPQHG